MTIATVIYALCALTSLACFVLLLRSYRRSGHRLLFWSAMCFGLLTLNNVFLVLDLVVFGTDVDLKLWRLGLGFAAVMLLLFGLVWDEE